MALLTRPGDVRYYRGTRQQVTIIRLCSDPTRVWVRRTNGELVRTDRSNLSRFRPS